MISHNKINRLVSGFGVTPKRISTIQNGVYRLILEGGKVYVLKRMPVPLKALRWIDHSLSVIRKQGNNKLGWRERHTKEGHRLFVQFGQKGSPYILIPWISGRWPSVHSASDMRACGVTLAQFHRSAKRSVLPRRGAVNMVGRWPATIRSQKILMSRIIKRASDKRNRRSKDRFLHTHRREILGYASKTQQLLQEHQYLSLCRTRRHLITLCHGDGGPSNFIMNNKGRHLIDFETLRVDLRAYDLYRMIYNCCKDHSWRFSIAKPILDGYQSVNKLERSDFMLLYSLLRFPQTTYGLLHHSRHLHIKERKYLVNNLSRALVAERKVGSFLKQLNRYARGQG